MGSFEFRAVEVHSQDAWDYTAMMRVLDFAKAHDFNAVVLHRNDIVDRVVHPAKYFGAPDNKVYKSPHERYQHMFRTLQKYTPTRRTRPIQRRDYLRRLVHEARQVGIDIYLQNKELWFPDVVVELHPEVLKHGHICPSAPFWEGFLHAKYTQLFEDIPDLAGVITSPATAESRASYSANRCECEDCVSITASEWYMTVLMAMYRPITKAGKRLVVRDFSFNPEALEELGSTMERLPEDVVVSLKNTPHDFYPTYPNNGRIGRVGARHQWIEFDSMGQFIGWGVIPSILFGDLRERFEYAESHGATGVIFRTDWEGLEGHSVFRTLNLLNLYAGSLLTRDFKATDAEVCHAWLEGEELFRPGLSPAERTVTAAWAAEVFGATWGVIEKSLYMNGCVFCESSMLPVSLDHAWWLAEVKNSISRWDPSKANALALDLANVGAILQEKDEALELATGLLRVVELGEAGLSDAAHERFSLAFSMLVKYVRCLRAVGQACISARYLLDREPAGLTHEDAVVKLGLESSLAELLALADEMESFYATTNLDHTAYMLLSSERLIAVHDDVLRALVGSRSSV